MRTRTIQWLKGIAKRSVSPPVTAYGKMFGRACRHGFPRLSAMPRELPGPDHNLNRTKPMCLAYDHTTSTDSDGSYRRITHPIGLCVLGWGLVLVGLTATAHADRTTAKNGRLLFQDTFSQSKLRKVWRVHPNSFRIDKGVLIAGQRPDAHHGAVCDVLVDFKDLFLEFSFMLDGSAGFNVVIDDRKYRGSHAGHICRVAVRRKRITLGDDKTGNMKKGLFEKRRSPRYRSDKQFRKQINRLLAGKSTSVPVDLKRGHWYRMTVRITGKTMRVALDGKPLATLTSEGIAHPTKTDFGFTVLGRFTRFDDVSARSPGRE